MQITALFLMKIILVFGLLSYIVGTFNHFIGEGYNVINTILQSGLHLVFCAYALFGWISLLINTPGLGLQPLIIIGLLWLISCYLLYFILDYLRSSIPRKKSNESAN